MTRAVLGVMLALGVCAGARAAYAKGCHETSYVVGREHCTRFGNWSREQDSAPFWIDVGFTQHSYRVAPFSLGSAPLVGAAGGPDLATQTSSPIDERFLYGIAGLFYTGLELDTGWMGKTPRDVGQEVDGGGIGAVHAIFGAHVALWRVSVGGELAAGGRVTSLLGGCDGDTRCPTADSTFQSRRELEARATIDFWVTPHVSIGGGLGKSLIDTDDTRFLIYIGGHVRALDGMR